MVDVRQFYDFVVVPTLDVLDLPHADAAGQLVMGTVAQESGFQWVHQLGGGPALGLCQMEPDTLASLRVWLSGHQDLEAKVASLANSQPYADQLPGNLYLSVAMCRVDYWTVPTALPAFNDVEAQYVYYKKYYNSELGSATRAQYANAWNTLVRPSFPGWEWFR